MLHSVWNVIPAFRGCDQQDAQEFLCELLDKVQQELEADGGYGAKQQHTRTRIVIPITQRKLSKQVLKVLNTIFHGQLLSQVSAVEIQPVGFNLLCRAWQRCGKLGYSEM